MKNILILCLSLVAICGAGAMLTSTFGFDQAYPQDPQVFVIPLQRFKRSTLEKPDKESQNHPVQAPSSKTPLKRVKRLFFPSAASPTTVIVVSPYAYGGYGYGGGYGGSYGGYGGSYGYNNQQYYG